jgi:predicted nucleotidyltransferase
MFAPTSATSLDTELFALEQKLGANWSHLRDARNRTKATLSRLHEALVEFDSADTSIIAFGSLARGEFTDGSDIDWNLLVDGCVDHRHFTVAREIAGRVAEISTKPVGAEATFGRLVFSHELVHHIGGDEDRNRNTTLRCLLLLESISLGRDDARSQVIRAILNRYLPEDRTFWEAAPGRLHVPRFLVNDFARYWRTMAVDFAYKRRERLGKGASIRNLKLRFSRKLLYVSALLACFSCELGFAPSGSPAACTFEREECVACLQALMRKTPLDMVALVLLRYLDRADTNEAAEHIARSLFGAYDEFVAILSNQSERAALENLPPEVDDDPLFQKGREASHKFNDAVLDLFFDLSADLKRLTRVYGVF